MVVKYETEYLTCNTAKDEKGNRFWEIWEKDNKETPIAIYVDEKTMHLANRFPVDEETYKYFNELCEIIGTIYTEEL